MSENNESFSETASHTGAISADQLPQNQQIRHVHSHPLMSLGPPDSGSRSLGNLPQTEINNSNLGGENFVVNQGNLYLRDLLYDCHQWFFYALLAEYHYWKM